LVIHWYQNKNYYNTLTLRKKIENAISTGEITPHLFFHFSQTKTDNAKWPNVLIFFGGEMLGILLRVRFCYKLETWRNRIKRLPTSRFAY
jgi:hypothetical protein